MRLTIRESVLLRVVLLTWAACGVGCGGDNEERTSQTQGRRLGWSQQAASLQQVQAFTFNLYIDDVSRGLSGAACEEAGGASFVCSAPLPQLGPGRHVLQLTSVLNGVESPRSEPLEVSGDIRQVTAALEPNGQGSALSATACLKDTATECYGVHEIAAGLSGVSALSPAPDGRLFFVEGNVQVRVVADGALIGEPALTLRDGRARIVGLTVDTWSFPESRFVFVAWSEPGPSDPLLMNVTRYREVGNTLGEGATILTGIPVPRDVTTLLAVDRSGYVYVAVPGFDSGPSGGSGVVLRITRDGRVPPDNRLGLPAFVAGFSMPTSLSTDPDQKAIWLGGRNPDSTYTLGFVPTSPEQSPSPRVIAQVASEQPVSFVLSGTASPIAFFVVANGLLSKAMRTDDGNVTGYLPLDLGAVRPVTAAAGESGAMYAATETAIFELRRLQSR